MDPITFYDFQVALQPGLKVRLFFIPDDSPVPYPSYETFFVPDHDIPLDSSSSNLYGDRVFGSVFYSDGYLSVGLFSQQKSDSLLEMFDVLSDIEV